MKHLCPVDRGLAARLASASGTTLLALGLEPPPAPIPERPSPVLKPEPVAPPPDPRLVDSVLVVAADGLNVAPAAVRAILHAAFKRARELGLDVRTVENALAPARVKAKT